MYLQLFILQLQVNQAYGHFFSKKEKTLKDNFPGQLNKYCTPNH